MSFEAGAVHVLLSAKFAPAGFAAFSAATQKAATDMRKAEAAITASSGAAGKGMAAMKVGALAAAAGLGGIALVAVKAANSARQFEAGMRNVNTIAKVSEGQLKSLSGQVLQLAAATGQKPKALTDGLYDIVSSGFEADDAMTVLTASAKAATAGLTDTGTSAKAVSAVLNAYKLPASEAAKVSDQLFQTVNAGVITFEELARNIGDVLPFAAPLNVGLDQVGAALSTITKNGVPAAQAATQVKSVFSQLLSPSDALATAVKKTGAANAESLVKTKGFQGALLALAGTTDGSKAALSQLFPNVEALSAALNLTGENARGARDDLKSFQDVTGTTDAALQEQQKSFEVQLNRLSAGIEAAMITIGSELLPMLTPKLKEWSDAIANGLEDGSIQEFADGFAGAIKSMVDAVGDLAGGIDEVVSESKQLADDFLGVVTTIVDGVIVAAKALNSLPGPDIDISALEDANDRVNEIREGLRPKPPPVKINVDIIDARKALREIAGTKLEAKVVKVLGSDRDAKQKLGALIALGIPRKIAHVLANVGNALAGITSVQGAIDRLQTYKELHIRTINETQNVNLGRIDKEPNRLTPRPRKRASGRGPEGAETALVGEGAVAREYVIDPLTGEIRRVDAPTIMSLPDSAYVIATDPSMRDRSLGLFGDLARELGIPGYHKGKKGHKHAAKKAPAKKKREYEVPERVALGGVPFDDVEADYKERRDSFQNAKKDVESSEEKLSDLRTRLGRAKTKEAKRTARAAIRDEEKRLRGRRALLARRERPFRRSEKDWKAAKRTNDEVLELETEANLAGDAMSDAAKRDDPNAFKTAKTDRSRSLRALIKVLQASLRLANPKSQHARMLRERISKLGGKAAVAGGQPDGGDLFDAETQALDVEEPVETEAQRAAREAGERMADTGMSDAERASLNDLEAARALAELTEGLGDDKAAAGGKLGFLESILAATLVDPARGGSATVASIAGMVKQARDEVTALAGGGGTVESADLQAQIDQANDRTRVAEGNAAANAAALAAFSSSGDIGTGRYGSAMGAAANIVIQTLHPGDPQTLDAIGRAATAGVGLQGSSSNPPLRVGG